MENMSKENEAKYMLDIIPTYEEREDVHKVLKDLPENDSIFKCDRCKAIFDIYSGGNICQMYQKN